MARGSLGLLGALGALLCVPALSFAQPPPHIAVQLDYVLGPRGDKLCPDLAELRGAIKADFGYDPIQADAPWRLTVAVNPGVGGVIQATMELRDPAGTVIWKDHKKAINNDCDTLISGVALSVRISLDSRVPPAPAKPAPGETKPAPQQPKPKPEEPKPAPPSTKPATSPRPPPAQKSSLRAPAPIEPSTETWERPRLRTGLAAAFAFGAAPAPSLALSFQLGIRLPYASLSLEGRGDLPVMEEEGVFSTSRIAALLVPCGHFKFFAGCLLGTVGRQYAFNDLANEGAWYAGGGVRVGLELPLIGPVALRLSGDVLATAPFGLTVRTDGMAERWSTPPINAAFSGGFVADL
jgi:hypothetical protein